MATTRYQDLYGREWTTDEAYGTDTENAGYLFLKKLAQNEPGIQPGGDEVDAAYATLGMDPSVEPGYGWTGYDSYETTLDGELAMAPCLTLEPVVGILKANYLAIANNAPHPNAAKLFLRWWMTPEGQLFTDKLRLKGNPMPGAQTAQSKSIEKMGIEIFSCPVWEVESIKGIEELYGDAITARHSRDDLNTCARFWRRTTNISWRL